MGHLVGEIALVERVRTLDDDGRKLLVPGAHTLLLRLSLPHV